MKKINEEICFLHRLFQSGANIRAGRLLDILLREGRARHVVPSCGPEERLAGTADAIGCTNQWHEPCK